MKWAPEPCWTSSFQHASRTPSLLLSLTLITTLWQGTQKSPLTSKQKGKSCSWFPKLEKVGALVSHPLTSGPCLFKAHTENSVSPFVFSEAQSGKGIKMAGSALQTKYVTSLILAVKQICFTYCDLKIILLCFYYIFHDKGQLALMWRSENPGFVWAWECVIWTEFLCILEYGLQMWGCPIASTQGFCLWHVRSNKSIYMKIIKATHLHPKW